MKKLITICLTMVAISFSMQAQKKATAQKTTTTVTVAETDPTKEETIVWLMEKLNTYGVRKSFFARVKTQSFKNCYLTMNECEFTLTDEYLDEDHKEYFKIRHFPIVGIKVQDLQDCVFYYIPWNYQAVKVVDSRYPDKIEYEGSCLGGGVNFNSLILGEEGLVERIEKAFAHLATFCQEKKQKF